MGARGQHDEDEGGAPPRYFTLDLEIEFGEPMHIGWVAGGHRAFAPISGGVFEGPGLSGIVQPIGTDSRLRRAQGSCTTSVSTVLSTDDGACIALRCEGEGVAFGAEESANGDEPSPSTSHTLAVQCRFECGDPRYGWLDGALAVGEAHVEADHGDYRLFAVLPSVRGRP